MKWFCLLPCSMALLVSCAHDKLPTTVSTSHDEICFQREVLPLFTSYCSRVEGGCHDAGNPRIALVEYSSIMNGIQEGNADGSWYYHVIGRGMPPGAEPQLSAAQLEVIRAWIDQGAKNSNCDDMPCDSTQVKYHGGTDRIFADYCNGCHNSVVYPNARAFATPELIRAAILANPERFLHSIGYAPGPQSNMPPTFMMNACDLHKLEAWVHAGMPD